MTKKAIIFDLDGTLAESKSPLEREMGALLARLLSALPVAVMSGGSYAQFQKQLLSGMPADANLANLYLFPVSAAQCYAWRDGAWQSLYDNPFTPEERTRILAALDESLRETGLDRPPAQLWGEQVEDRGAQITWSALGQEAPVEAKSAWDPDRAKRAPLQAALLRRLPGFSVRVNAGSSIDITHAGITKAYGVRRLSELLALPLADMLYIGDALFPGGNDEIVKETGIATRQVSGPAEATAVIEKLLSNKLDQPVQVRHASLNNVVNGYRSFTKASIYGTILPMYEVRLPKILFLALEIASFYRNTFFNTNDLARLAERYASDLVRLRRDKTDYRFQNDTRAGGLRGNLSTLLTWQGFVKRGSKIVSTYSLGPDKRLVNAICNGDVVLDKQNMTAHTNSESLRNLLIREARLLDVREGQAHIKQKLEKTKAILLERVPDRFPKDSVVKSPAGQYFLRALLNNYVGSNEKVIQYSLVNLWEGKRFRFKNMHLLIVIPKDNDAWAEIYAVKSEELFKTKPMLLNVDVEMKQCADQHDNTYTLYPLDQAIREFSTEDENKQERLSHDWDMLKTEYCEKDVAEEVRKEDEFSQFLRLFLGWRHGFKIDGKEVVDIVAISSGGPDVELLYKGGTRERVELEHVWRSYLDHGHYTNSAFAGCWVFAEEKFDKDLIERFYRVHVEKHKDRLPSTFLCVENGEPKAWRIDWDTGSWSLVSLSFD